VDEAHGLEVGTGKKGITWPLLMMAAVARYGASRVWDVGIEVLGFPPTLITQIGERDKVQAALIQTGMNANG
jgi:hypothetical protein